MENQLNLQERVEKILRALSPHEKALLCTGASDWTTMAVPEAGLPSLRMSDGSNGVRFQEGSDGADKLTFLELMEGFDTEDALRRTFPATCFPAGSAAACSWDPQLLEEIGSAIAAEAKELGIGLMMTPGMNLRRHPLAGRAFEYYAEDPVLAGEMASGMVAGIQREGVGACVKHFACNNADYERTRMDSVIGIRALREIYLAAFERVVKKARPAAVMGAYNKINGTQACENRWLLTDVLRGEWGFEGVILSDWGAVKDPVNAFLAGLDLQMPHSDYDIRMLEEALRDGRIDAALLDEHCRRMISLALSYSREGREAGAAGAGTADIGAHHLLARKAAAESAVLLKNAGGVLPIDSKRVKKLAVLGSIAEHPYYQGTGCTVVHARKVDIPLEEIRNAAGSGIEVTFAPGYTQDNRTTPALLEEAGEAARNADMVILFAGSKLPLEDDNYVRPSIGIEEAHVRLIEQVASVGKPCAVVLSHGETVTMPWIDGVQAVLDCWYGGEGSGKAVADLLFGQTCPSGKLPVTVPLREEDTPAFLEFPSENGSHVYMEAGPHRQPTVTADMHYLDLFRDQAATAEFFDFLVENGLLKPDQIDDTLKQRFCRGFWGIAQHLDMVTEGKITPDMVEKLVQRINATRK